MLICGTIFIARSDINPYELALSSDEIRQLRQHMVDARMKYSIAIIDTYWDADGNGMCPAAEGLSHHINASGYVEPCPIIQFAADHVDEKSLDRLYAESGFLGDFRTQIQQKTKGCVVMEDPRWLAEFVQSTMLRIHQDEKANSNDCNWLLKPTVMAPAK